MTGLGVVRLVVLLVVLLDVLLVGRSVVFLVGLAAGLLVGRSAGRRFGLLVERLVGRSVGRVVASLELSLSSISRVSILPLSFRNCLIRLSTSPSTDGVFAADRTPTAGRSLLTNCPCCCLVVVDSACSLPDELDVEVVV